MSLLSNDTIVALATAPLPAGVAIIRISGNSARAISNKLSNSFNEIPSRVAHFARLKSQNGELLDEALMIFFENPASFTGEDVVEIHCHGGQAVIKAIIDDILSYNTPENPVRHAEAGEFTRRAFLNGKMDLTAAEGIMDIVAAQTEQQRKQALRQLQGALAERFEGWRGKVLELLANIEAAIDFPDEELDIMEETGVENKISMLILALKEAVSLDEGSRLREGFNVVIVGEPNAGKSSLTNLLTGRDTAIVSPIKGTTRDVLEAHLDIGGFPIVLADTAGLRKSEDEIEREGISRAHSKAKDADLTIVVADGDKWSNIPDDIKQYLCPEKSMIVVSKVDKNQMVEYSNISAKTGINNQKVKHECLQGFIGNNIPVIHANLTNKESLPEILKALQKMVEKSFANVSNGAQLTRERHKAAVNNAIMHLERAQNLCKNPPPEGVSELIAQDLRDTAAAIGSVTGGTDTENVLDLVFSTFCIGK